MTDDKELEFITAKRMIELRRRLSSERKELSNRELLVSRLVNRGVEVLQAAERSYPNETRMIVDRLAELIRKRVVNGLVSGGELLWLFRTLGLNVNVKTSIKVEEHGRLVSLSEKLKFHRD